MADADDLSLMVHVGRDGWLFLVGGSNDPLSLYRRSAARRSLIWRWTRLIHSRARRCRGLGIRYLHVPIPEKLAVYHDKLNGLDVDPSLGLARPLARLMPDVCLDLRSHLVAGRARSETYLRLDTHWTSDGCRIGHDAICAEVGAPYRWRMEDRPLMTFPDQPGDLGSKMNPLVREPAAQREILRDAQCIFLNPLVHKAMSNGRAADLHQGAHIVFRNEAADADPRIVVLLGDSYASFLATGLTAMLAETFREVHFLWHTWVDWAYVERVRPDLLIVEMAERFLVEVPPIDGSLDVDAFANSKMADFEPLA
jgi:alginate O-acetyltransferase complex protein AlgJ